jgi:hypothetical protein
VRSGAAPYLDSMARITVGAADRQSGRGVKSESPCMDTSQRLILESLMVICNPLADIPEARGIVGYGHGMKCAGRGAAIAQHLREHAACAHAAPFGDFGDRVAESNSKHGCPRCITPADCFKAGSCWETRNHDSLPSQLAGD